MKIIDEQLLNEVGAQAKESPRLRTITFIRAWMSCATDF